MGVAVGFLVGVGFFVGVEVGEAVAVAVGVIVGASAVWVAKILAAISVLVAAVSASDGPHAVRMTHRTRHEVMMIFFLCILSSLTLLLGLIPPLIYPGMYDIHVEL